MPKNKGKGNQPKAAKKKFCIDCTVPVDDNVLDPASFDVLLWIAAQRTFQSSAQRFRPSALTQMAPGHRESRRARHTVT